MIRIVLGVLLERRHGNPGSGQFNDLILIYIHLRHNGCGYLLCEMWEVSVAISGNVPTKATRLQAQTII